MGRPKTIEMEFRCRVCDFSIELKGTEKNIIDSYKNLIKYHKEYSPKCKSSKYEDFDIKAVSKKENEEDKYIANAKKLVEKRFIETDEKFKKENPKLDDIIGQNDVKNILANRLINYIQHKEKLADIKKYPSSGMILAGIQGTGKTEIIKAAINDIIFSNEKYKIKFNVIIMKSHDFMSGTVGESGKKIEAILDIVRELNKKDNKETILIIDEIDNLVPDRETRSVLTSERTGSLLDEFGGSHGDHSIFFVGTTNKPDRIDSEALVAGRFGNPILVNIPSKEERFDIFTKFVSNLSIDESINNKEYINEYFNYFTGRDLYYFVVDLQIIYFEKERKEEHNSKHIITHEDIVNLLETPNYRNTNELNKERLNKLATYYNKYNEEVRGSKKFVDEKAIISQFISDKLEISLNGNSSFEFTDIVFNCYCTYPGCISMTRNMFTRYVTSIDERIRIGHPKKGDGKQHSAYYNVKLKDK